MAVLTNFFGGDLIPLNANGLSNVTFKSTSTDSWQLGTWASNAWSIKPATGITRSYTNFSQLAAECAQSRIYGGVQYNFSTAAGSALGAAVAADVLASYPGALATAMPSVWAYLTYVPPAVTSSVYGECHV